MLLMDITEESLTVCSSPQTRSGDLPLLARKLRRLLSRAMDCGRKEESGVNRPSHLPSPQPRRRYAKRITFVPDVLLRDACRRADMVELTELLRSNNAALCTSVNASGRTALHEAVLLGHMPVVEAFLRHGADPNALDGHGRRPLHTVAATGHASMARLLLEFGAKVHLYSADMRLPVDMAGERSDLRMMQLLSKAAHAQEAALCQEARAHAHAIAPPSHAHSWACRRPSFDAAMQQVREATVFAGKAPLDRRASDEVSRPRPRLMAASPPPRDYVCHHPPARSDPRAKRSSHQRQRSQVIYLEPTPMGSRELVLDGPRRPRMILPSGYTMQLSTMGEVKSVDL